MLLDFLCKRFLSLWNEIGDDWDQRFTVQFLKRKQIARIKNKRELTIEIVMIGWKAIRGREKYSIQFQNNQRIEFDIYRNLETV